MHSFRVQSSVLPQSCCGSQDIMSFAHTPLAQLDGVPAGQPAAAAPLQKRSGVTVPSEQVAGAHEVSMFLSSQAPLLHAPVRPQGV